MFTALWIAPHFMEEVGYFFVGGMEGDFWFCFTGEEHQKILQQDRQGCTLISAQGALTFEGAVTLWKRVQTPDFSVHVIIDVYTNTSLNGENNNDHNVVLVVIECTAGGIKFFKQTNLQ